MEMRYLGQHLNNPMFMDRRNFIVKFQVDRDTQTWEDVFRLMVGEIGHEFVSLTNSDHKEYFQSLLRCFQEMQDKGNIWPHTAFDHVSGSYIAFEIEGVNLAH